MSAISVQHISRLWGATRAVDDVSFEGAGPLEVISTVYVPLAKPVYVAYGLVSVTPRPRS